MSIKRYDPATAGRSRRPTERQLLQQAWRQALAQGGLSIPLPDIAAAMRLRTRLYAATQAVRQGTEQDEELLQAVSELKVQAVRQGEAAAVEIVGKLSGAEYEGLLAVLDGASAVGGGTVAPESRPALPAEEQAAAAAARAVAAALALPEEVAPASAPRSTPYYSR